MCKYFSSLKLKRYKYNLNELFYPWTDSDYLKFVENLQNPDPEPVTSLDNYLEELENREKVLKGIHLYVLKT